MSQHIVVIGAGFAGIWSALSARRLISSSLKTHPEAAEVEVIVIAPEPRLTLRPRLYEVDPASKAVPMKDLLDAANIRFIQGTVDAIRAAEKEVDIVNPAGGKSKQSYHRLVLAAGSSLVRPRIPGLEEHAYNVDQVEEATRLEAHLQSLVSLPSSPARNTVIVCGAGFTGIEVAAEMPSRLRSILGQDADVHVILVARSDEVGETLGAGPRPVITKALDQMGIITKLSATITAIDAGGISTADGERIEAATTIWTAGVAPTPLAGQLPGDKDEYGRVCVDAELRLPSNKEILVAGDAASAATDKEGHRTLMSCQHAMPMGKVAGYNAAAELLHLPPVPYTQLSYITCLDLGTYGAVVTNGWDRKVVFSGFVGKRLKRYINTVLISAPSDATKALAAAHPENPSSQLLLDKAFSFLGFFTGRFA